jgi:beta-galactosidase
MDYCGFPKDGYYAYKAAWRDEPLVHIFPHWNWKGQEGDSIKVQGYTNCDEVELFVNGKSIGRQKAVPFNKLQWVAIYKPGKLLAKGYKNGKLVATDLVETAGEPAQIGLQSDVKTLAANGMDVVVVNVAIKDSKGRVVPTADNLVKFFVEGPAQIFGTGNGNPSSHEPDKAAQRMAFNGYCMLLVQSSKNPGIIKIKAVSDKLKSAEITIQSKMGERK